MRKLLLNSTAIATVAALTASVAVADVSISASTEFKYKSRSSQVTASDGTTFATDSEIHFKFSNKTDSGLTIGYVVEMLSDGANTAIDESSMSISGGFGKVVLGENDGVGDNFGIAAMDLIAEESNSIALSHSINTNSDIANLASNTTQIAYFLPAMGGFTAGASFADSGETSGTDTTEFGAKYTMDAGGNTITLGAATGTKEAATTDTDSQNMGIKVVSGNLSMIVSNGSYEAADEDRSTQGVAVSYKMANGMTLGAYSMKSEDDLDVGEEYTAAGVEAQYTIAAGLTAVVTVDDYEYTATTGTADTAGTSTGDAGTTTSLTIKASF
jgi:hypothetical protein